jgi:antirestriction protein ArdC
MNRESASFAALLEQAVSEPGIISSAYSAFHNYSFGNILLAAVQCTTRGIPFGPIATFARWKSLGRYVRRGEKALTLCQPVTIRRKADETTEEDDRVIVRFTFRNSWFVVSQTDGADVPALTLPEWEQGRALAKLNVSEIPFSAPNGNVMGYARGRSIAVSPVNPRPHKTLFHEVAHVLLGHTAEGEQADGDVTPRNLKEAEAEAVALLCCEALGLPGGDECRGYIQSWWGQDNPIPERSAQRVLRVADEILKAGRPEGATEETEGVRA